VRVSRTERLQLIAALLDVAHDRLSDATCSDLPDTVRAMLTSEQWDEIDLEEHVANGDPEEHEPGNSEWIADWVAMSWAADWLRREAGRETKG